MRSTNERFSHLVVMQLMRPYLNKERIVTADSQFTAVKLATQQKERQAILLRMLNKIGREVPLSLRKMKDLHSCKVYKFEHITLTANQGKMNKHGLVLGTMYKKF